jgi:hypothetical protein
LRSWRGIPAATSIVEAQDRHLGRGHGEGDGNPSLEAYDAQAGPNVVATLSALGRERETSAKTFDAVDIAKGYVDACAFSNPVAEL